MIELPRPTHDHLDTPEWRIHAERALAWSGNPHRDQIRRKAEDEIRKRIGEIVEPLGFQLTESGHGWERSRGLRTCGIYIQNSKYGDRCFFNLSKRCRFKLLSIFVMSPMHKRLGAFYDPGYDRVGEPGALFFYDIDDLPHYVDQAMDVLRRKAVPWLLE